MLHKLDTKWFLRSSGQNVLCFGTMSLDTTALLNKGRLHHLLYCSSITNYSSGDHFFSQFSFVSFGPDPIADLHSYCLTICQVCTYSSLHDSNECQTVSAFMHLCIPYSQSQQEKNVWPTPLYLCILTRVFCATHLSRFKLHQCRPPCVTVSLTKRMKFPFVHQMTKSDLGLVGRGKIFFFFFWQPGRYGCHFPLLVPCLIVSEQQK